MYVHVKIKLSGKLFARRHKQFANRQYYMPHTYNICLYSNDTRSQGKANPMVWFKKRILCISIMGQASRRYIWCTKLRALDNTLKGVRRVSPHDWRFGCMYIICIHHTSRHTWHVQTRYAYSVILFCMSFIDIDTRFFSI